MGLSNSAQVFYGTFVPHKSVIGQKLDDIMDEFGGEPASVEGHPGIEISTIGANCTGRVWMIIAAKGSIRSYGYGDDVEPPAALHGPFATWRERLEAFLESIDAPGVPSIGWYFGSKVI